MNLHETLEKANKIQDTFGLNVKGNSLALLKSAAEERPNENLYDVWEDIGEDLIRMDKQACVGHLSSTDSAILMEACKELIPLVLEECDTWNEIERLLKG